MVWEGGDENRNFKMKMCRWQSSESGESFFQSRYKRVYRSNALLREVCLSVCN